MCIGFIWLRIGKSGGDESSGSVNCREFLDGLSNLKRLKYDSALGLVPSFCSAG